MTPNDIEEASRRRYNAVGDTNWTSQEFWDLIWDACLKIARESLCIERTYTTSTVASQQEYSYPTNTIAIKRVTYENRPLCAVSLDDLPISSTTPTGTPSEYAIWNETLYLISTPSAVGTIKIFSYNEPQEITSGTDTLEVPTQFHMGIVDYVLAEMYRKDKDFASAARYQEKFDTQTLGAARRWQAKKKATDRPRHVRTDEDVGVMNQ